MFAGDSGLRLDGFKPLVKILPEIAPPQRMPSLNEKLMWVGIALLMFFVMYHVEPVGAIIPKGGQFEFLQVVLANNVGSLITAGIGPIILSSIFLQLFVGAKIIEINLQDPEQKRLFTGVQKILAVVLAFFESAVYVISNNVPITGSIEGTAPLLGSILFTQVLVILQLALGSIILMFLDEIVSKYGIGSGISLFIAAGVSMAIFSGTVSILVGYGGIPQSNTVIYWLSQGGADAIPNALLALMPIFFTILVFLVTSYAEGMKVQIPLAYERARGFGGRFPIKFLYVSNIPVILASALMMNMQLWARVLSNVDVQLGGVNAIKLIADVDPSGRTVGGLLYLITPHFPSPLAIAGGYPVYLQTFLLSIPLTVPFIGVVQVPEMVNVFLYILFFTILCVIFGSFWIETTGMGPKDVAAQLNRSGLQIPGFRRDPRVMEKILEKYIPTITLLGSVFVGLLASFADLTGALGTGTGILLTVGIINRLYEELNQQRLFDIHPELRNFIG